MDYHALPALDINLAVAPDALVTALLAALGNPKPAARNGATATAKTNGAAAPAGSEIGIDAFSHAVSAAFAGQEVCFTRLPLGVNENDFDLVHHSIFSAATAAAGSAAASAPRSVRRSRCAARHGCRCASPATAIS